MDIRNLLEKKMGAAPWINRMQTLPRSLEGYALRKLFRSEDLRSLRIPAYTTLPATGNAAAPSEQEGS